MNKNLIVLQILTLILFSCKHQTPFVGRSLIASPHLSPIPTSEAGKVTVVGRVISLSNQPVSQTPVWLAEVVRQGEKGVYVLDSRASPSAYTNEMGVFIIPNVNPGEYVIVVGNPEGLYEIITGPSGKARVWNILSDRVFEIGELRVSLPKK